MDASPVKAGQVLAGKYRIERVLGEGGMGVVVEAHDIGLERRVAIKFLLPGFVRHPEATQRFMREARAAAKIQSEHVARVIDVSTLENGAPYMVMEFLEGSDLSRVIEAGGALPIEDAALYIIQACEALAEAHAYGIIHRDLKPANLFLAQQAGGSRKIKVLDFGISKTLSAVDPAVVGSLTGVSTMMGSPLYMSPEQMKSSRDVDLRTDIWALGVILYEALTGNTPFTGDSIPEISAKILLEDPPPLGQVKPEIAATLADVVVKALRKQPEMRFQSVGELAMALLPFAPNRARNNVERIVRVLNAAGMAQGEFLASLAPQDQVHLFGDSVEMLRIKDISPVGASLLRTLGKKHQATLANFGHTQTERAPSGRLSRSRRMLVAGAASILTVGLGVGLALRFGAPALPKAAAIDSSARGAAAASPAGSVAPPAVSVAPSVRPVPPSAEAPRPLGDAARPLAGGLQPPADLPHPLTDAPEGAATHAVEKASSAAPTPTVKAPAAPAASGAPKAVLSSSLEKRARASSLPARKPARKPREKSYSGDFKSKFGSRK